MRSRPGVVIQARTGSTRLPGKVLLRVQGDTLLGHLLRRLSRCRRVLEVVVATTTRAEDEAIVLEASRHSVPSFCGSESDVLSRYLGAAHLHGFDPVVRVTSDCPLLDPVVVDEAVALFLDRRTAGTEVDVVTNGRPGKRTYPRGLDVEVAALAALEAADASLGPDAPEREHVTQVLYRHPERFRFADLLLPFDLSFLRLTVDTEADFALVRQVFDDLYPTTPDFDMRDVLALLGRRPELLALNLHVRQKAT